MIFLNLSDIAILNTKGSDYCCIITGTSKSEAIKLLQNIYSDEENYKLKKINFFESIYKNGKECKIW